jgi:hypothetical protein
MNYGIPTAPIGQEHIIPYARGDDFLYSNGMPLRYTAVPTPVAGLEEAQILAYLNGNDPTTGKPVKQSIVDALTAPLTDNEKMTGMPPESEQPPRYLEGTEEYLQEYIKSQDWTDYLPVVLPTEERVNEMLTGTSHPADEIVKIVTWPAGNREMTVERVAIAAVMAGAKPEYFPAILAIASQAPMGNSTTSMANAIIFNGPIRQELGINCGSNAMGPYAEANAVIGRAFTIISKTVGGMHGPNAPDGLTTFSSLGSGLQYNNLCIGENEEMLPAGWDPLHVQLGFDKNDSVVTVATGWTYISSVGECMTDFPAQEWIADYMSAMSGFGGACIFVDPSVARILSEVQDFSSKDTLSEWFCQNVSKTATDYWQNGVVATFNASTALQGIEPYYSWYKAWQEGRGDEVIIYPYTNPMNVKIVVVGGNKNTIWFATDFRPSMGVNIADWE